MHFFIFSSFWFVRAQKNELSIIMNVNLYAGNGIGPLSDFANFTSKPISYFA